MSNVKYILDCVSGNGDPSCTMSNYSPPPEVSYYHEYGFSGTTITWALICFVIFSLAFLAATAIVRYKAHEERGQTERAQINKVVKQCPTCGDKV